MKDNSPIDETDPETESKSMSADHSDSINSETIESGVDITTKHTKSIHLEHPVEDVEDLYGSEYGQYLLREAQVDDGVEPGDRSEEAERRVEQAFDLHVIETTIQALEFSVTDATHREFPIPDSAVLALVLKHVRNAPADDFTAHVQALPKVLEELGVDEDLDERTLTEWEHELTDADAAAIDACATRVLYAVYRSGQAFPQQVWSATVATSDTKLLTTAEKKQITNGQIPAAVTRDALRNWAREFIQRVLQDEFSIGRDQSLSKYSVMSIVGVFAHAALQSRTMTGACSTCSEWYADPELVPDRTTVMEPIRDLSVDEIAKLFQHLNQRFLQFADEYTILQGSKQLAFDPTSIPHHAGSEDDRWTKGYKPPLKGDVTSSDFDKQWEFGLTAVTEGDVRFALGMFPINNDPSDDEQDRQSVSAADVASRLLRSTRFETPVSVDLIAMDRGLSGVDLISRCRDTVGDNWMILGKHKKELKRLVAETPQDESRFYELEEYFDDLSDKPNALVVPAPHGARSEHSQWVFLTDLPREVFLNETNDGNKVLDKEIAISRYQQRCHVEKTLEEIKHNFNIPVKENTHTRVKYFTLNMSMLFYNLHNLIANGTSPMYGLPLGKTRGATNGEVLSAIREVAFELADEQKNR